MDQNNRDWPLGKECLSLIKGTFKPTKTPVDILKEISKDSFKIRFGYTEKEVKIDREISKTNRFCLHPNFSQLSNEFDFFGNEFLRVKLMNFNRLNDIDSIESYIKDTIIQLTHREPKNQLKNIDLTQEIKNIIINHKLDNYVCEELTQKTPVESRQLKEWKIIQSFFKDDLRKTQIAKANKTTTYEVNKIIKNFMVQGEMISIKMKEIDYWSENRDEIMIWLQQRYGRTGGVTLY